MADDVDDGVARVNGAAERSVDFNYGAFDTLFAARVVSVENSDFCDRCARDMGRQRVPAVVMLPEAHGLLVSVEAIRRGKSGVERRGQRVVNDFDFAQ